MTDFGMVKLYDVNHSTAHLTPLTLCPGTMAYMSPEALRDRPVYTDKLDSFSLGVLCVQIMTRQFPDLGDRFNIIEINDPRAPSGRVQVEIPEIERRRSHINLIDPAHPLLPVALDCLRNEDRERPSCHELCGHMSTLKASFKYTESVQQSQVNTKPTQSANRESREREIQQSQQIQDLQQQLHTHRDQLRGKEQENQQQRQQILGQRNLLTAISEQVQTLQQQLTNKDEQLAGKDHQLQQKEAAIAAHQQEIRQLRQQLQSSEQVTAEFQQNLLEREKTIQDQQRLVQELQQQLRQRGGQRQEVGEASGAATSAGRIKLRWRDGGRAPCKIRGQVSTVNGSVAYLVHSSLQNKVHFYDSSSKKWSELPKCPNYGFSLAVVNSLLTAIGGQTGKMPDGKLTNLLFSYNDNKWTEQFPPMPTKRWLATAVCSGRSLVVAGGSAEVYLGTVEVMDTETLRWSTARSLPHPLVQATATLCGDQVYMLGGFYQTGKQSKSVFTCSLTALLQSCQSHSLGGRLKSLSFASGPKDLSRSEVWRQLADTPVTLSACALLHGQLLAVGGYDSDNKKTAAIHMYNTTTDSWEVISHMATPRSQCLVAVLPHNELMVVGGSTPDLPNGVGTDSIEIATVV